MFLREADPSNRLFKYIIYHFSGSPGEICGLVPVHKRRARARHRDVLPFSMAQAIENEGTGKSHFPIPFQKRPTEGRFWMLTS